MSDSIWLIGEHRIYTDSRGYEEWENSIEYSEDYGFFRSLKKAQLKCDQLNKLTKKLFEKRVVESREKYEQKMEGFADAVAAYQTILEKNKVLRAAGFEATDPREPRQPSSPVEPNYEKWLVDNYHYLPFEIKEGVSE